MKNKKGEKHILVFKLIKVITPLNHENNNRPAGYGHHI